MPDAVMDGSMDRQQSAFTRRSPPWANTDSAARIETQTSPRAIHPARAARYDPAVCLGGNMFQSGQLLFRCVNERADISSFSSECWTQAAAVGDHGCGSSDIVVGLRPEGFGRNAVSCLRFGLLEVQDEEGVR
ncbi:hypothetical protein, partial [Candidatus Mycobacterium methanotrophicum]|uniref:hypothetical protein n=1 Tax=Candidatus Mycobacterium methanotrophicum TaxID=2943498 RepID=UPI001C58EDC0